MYQIIKFCGITAEQIVALDKLLESVLMKAWIKKLRVRSNDKGTGYIYEIKVDVIESKEESEVIYGMKFEDRGRRYGTKTRTRIVHVPRDVMNAIYDALAVYPKESSVECTEWR